eukprot:SM000035S13152  [mRNA]  locus=s35:892852:894135:- [translate_table: standard]
MLIDNGDAEGAAGWHLGVQASIFHYGSISLIADPCRSAHIAAMETAKGAGALLSYDPNLRLPLWESADAARSGIRSIWEEADVIKISEEEITFLTEGGDPSSDEAALALFHDKLRLLIVTEGKDGCRYYTKEFRGRVGGLRVKAVDATGAGDAFVAGFLSQLARDPSIMEPVALRDGLAGSRGSSGQEHAVVTGGIVLGVQEKGRLEEALRFANACGALASTSRGAIPSLPTEEAARHLMASSGSEEAR